MYIDQRCAWKLEMPDFYPSRGIPMGMKTKLLEIMGMGRQRE